MEALAAPAGGMELLTVVQSLPSLWNGNGIRDLYSAQQEFDDLSAFEEIQQELIAQELLILEEYNNSMRNNLTVNRRFTSCPCGLYVNTAGGNVTAEVLQNLLERRVTEHTEDCLHNPTFSMAFKCVTVCRPVSRSSTLQRV